MPIRTKRWDDPREPDDGFRILVCRYRPRGLPKSEETWDQWRPELGPSESLHAAAYGKRGVALAWNVYRAAYLREMQGQTPVICELAGRVVAGETITLLCSSSCTREARCHRSILRELIEAEVARLQAGT
ncbi:MAG: hypothetical protein AMXMBFR13_30140 [Phycisphaerae bacterium]